MRIWRHINPLVTVVLVLNLISQVAVPSVAVAGYGATGNQGDAGMSALLNKARVGAYQVGHGAN